MYELASDPPSRPPSYVLLGAALSHWPGGHEYSGVRAGSSSRCERARARGSPESTPHLPSIWALSASAPPRPSVSARRGRPPRPLCHCSRGRRGGGQAGQRAGGRERLERRPICVGSEVTARPGRGGEAGSSQPAARTVGTRFNWQNATGQPMAALPRRTGRALTARGPQTIYPEREQTGEMGRSTSNREKGENLKSIPSDGRWQGRGLQCRRYFRNLAVGFFFFLRRDGK